MGSNRSTLTTIEILETQRAMLFMSAFSFHLFGKCLSLTGTDMLGTVLKAFLLNFSVHGTLVTPGKSRELVRDYSKFT